MPPDVPICMEISPTEGWCTNTVSDKEFTIDDAHPYSFYDDKPKQTWWELRPTFLLVPAPSYAALKDYIVKTCKEQKCDQAISSWNRTIQTIDTQLQQRQP
jgi:hypothetical protein